MAKKTNFYPIILAGGRGTRFWPLSRRKRAKQMLALDGDRTMIQQTVERLLPLADAKRFWIITNDDLRDGIAASCRRSPKKQIIAEPVGRNTAPAIGLAAFILERHDPDASPRTLSVRSRHCQRKRVSPRHQQAVKIAAAGENMVVMGIQPHRAETGYGYIEAGIHAEGEFFHVRRFTEKPNAETAEEFVAAGNFYWNSGMFIWGARTLANAVREHLPNTAPLLEEIAAAYGTRKFDRPSPGSIRSARTSASTTPCSSRARPRASAHRTCTAFRRTSAGTIWARGRRCMSIARAKPERQHHSCERSFVLNATGNYVHSPKKFVATVGVSNLVIVETDDALLITTRENSRTWAKW